MVTVKSYYSPGKILLCGEYGVLHGLEALALPVKKGQWMDIWAVANTELTKVLEVVWQSKDVNNNTWLEVAFQVDIEQLTFRGGEVPQLLKHLWIHAIQENSQFFKTYKTVRIETRLEFDQKSGLGSSSTWINNFCDWCRIDTHTAQLKVLNGSGYDVAIANVQKPLVFWLNNNVPNWSPWQLNIEISKLWTVVFLGAKVNSRNSVSSTETYKLVENSISKTMLDHVLDQIKTAETTGQMEMSLEIWQKLLSQLLGLPTPYDFFKVEPVKFGLCKWLGAWGGDMILVNEVFIKEYSHVLESYEKINFNQLCILS